MKLNTLLCLPMLFALLLTAFGCVGASADKVQPEKNSPKLSRAIGVCPPFMLRGERGEIINPVKGINPSLPYSPKQTCGASNCHNYEKITEGYHFTQGKGEKLPKEYGDRHHWVSFPGNYGGNWCSPAPLYRQLAKKHNRSAREIDMTSFDFVLGSCGGCHPGGGPLEYDRDGKRYDQWMADPASGFTPGGDNNFDGDYYKARWSQSGVIEADCLICHQPAYDFNKRNSALSSLNFKWAATYGAGFGQIKGKVIEGEEAEIEYDLSKFDSEGNVILHMAPSPRNETCLVCHSKPNWKKRGASFSPRTDVHIVAGMRCVDCHSAGSRAHDPRINEREAHQFGKGDCPSGFVRNDLDNTVRTCEHCHLEGWRNAPLASHEWLPPIHLDKISCQACHIPARAVKSGLVQASDVYNPAPRITPPGKHIWTFYDQEMNFWNHYGELDLFTAKDQPTNVTRPTLIRYKGKIYPANRVHSAWVGFEEEGKPGFNQLFMRDFYQMWVKHRSDTEKNYPELAKITDDSKSGVIEVNRPEEIDALLASVKQYLKDTAFLMEGRRLVWVANNRAYYSSTEYKELPKMEHEATAYASVYKFSHDVSPAKAALGAGGCTDCHRRGSPFFYGNVLERPFGEDGLPVWIPNYEILGLTKRGVASGAFREERVKPLLYGMIGLVVLLLFSLLLRGGIAREGALNAEWARIIGWAITASGIIAAFIVASTPRLGEYMIARRFSLDANHFWIGMLAMIVSVIFLIHSPASEPPLFSKLRRPISLVGWLLMLGAAGCGGLMLLNSPKLERLVSVSYLGFDLSLTLLAAVTATLLALHLARKPA